MRTMAAMVTPISSPICIFQGVPPRMWPTFRSCSMSPAMPHAQQTTPATASTPRMPLEPVTPIPTMTMAAMSRVLSVRPLIGLFELPSRPTR